MIDRLRYEVCFALWRIWHMDARRWFDGDRHLPYLLKSRPWWHMCCNGDCGGWRTRLCSFLECGWRYTDHYQKGP